MLKVPVCFVFMKQAVKHTESSAQDTCQVFNAVKESAQLKKKKQPWPVSAHLDTPANPRCKCCGMPC